MWHLNHDRSIVRFAAAGRRRRPRWPVTPRLCQGRGGPGAGEEDPRRCAVSGRGGGTVMLVCRTSADFRPPVVGTNDYDTAQTWFGVPRSAVSAQNAKATGPNRPAVPAGAARRSHPIIGRVLHQARGPAASRLHRAGLRLHGPLLDNREPSVVLLHHQPGSLSPGRHSFEGRTHQPLRTHRTHRSYRRRDCEYCGARGVRPVRFPRGLFVQSAGELGRLGEHRVLQWPRRYRWLPKPSLCPTTESPVPRLCSTARVWGLGTRVSAYAEH